MKPRTVKAVFGIAAVALVAVVYFIYGCDQGNLLPLLGAILILSGKESLEYIQLVNGGD